MKQTAVEWLIEQIKKEHPFWTSIFEQAKQMEKQQIEDAHIEGQRVFDKHPHTQWTNDQADQYYNETYGSKGSDDHIVDTTEMIEKGTLKKRMDKDGWFVVFQSNAYNESDMAYELLKSQEIDIDMYDVYKDGDEVTFEVVNKKWAKITPFLYPFKTTSSQTEISDAGKDTADYIDRHIIESMKELAREGFKPQVSEISDEEIEMAALHHEPRITRRAFKSGAKWYREQLKQK